MDFDSKKIAAADDETLRRAVKEAALAAGAGELKARFLSRDVEKIRRMLNSLTKDDVDSLAQAVGEENLKQIIDGVTKTGENDG